MDHPQLAGAHRHRADLSGARKGGRQSRGPDVGDLSRHADRAMRAGRGLFHHPRRRAAALHPAHRQPRHGHRQPRRLDHGQVVSGASSGEASSTRTSARSAKSWRRTTWLFAGRRSAARLDCRRQRRSAVCRTADAGRTDQDRVGTRLSGDERRPRPYPDAHDQREHGQATGMVRTKRRSTRSAR